MTRSRTILTVLLAAWLPLSCCCQLRALGELYTKVFGEPGRVANASERRSGCSGCRHHHEEKNSRPQPAAPAGDCGCGAHDREYVRGAVVDMSESGADEMVVMAAAIVPLTYGESARVHRASLTGCEARMKGRPTLLRLHCALVV